MVGMKGLLSGATTVFVWLLSFFGGAILVAVAVDVVWTMLVGGYAGLMVGRIVSWPVAFFIARWVTRRFEDWRDWGRSA